MKCIICKHGETRPGKVTVPLQRDQTTIVVKDVPAEVCAECGEYYLSEEVTAKILAKAEQAVQNGAELEIIRFAA